jgi:exodeoxyribonuclease-5
LESDIKLTQGQEQALKMVADLLKEESAALGILTGFAGTGKSFLLNVIAKLHGAPIILSPTGKAAVRVKELTGLPASTIHRWMYEPTEDPKTGETVWYRKTIDKIELPQNGLIVIDEASMVTDKIWADIWQLCSMIDLRVLLVGDTFQLPPVRPDNKDFSALCLPTTHKAHMTEIVRQAMDSPIIRASMLIREDEISALEAIGIIPAINYDDLAQSFVQKEGSKALITWRNSTRHDLNRKIRLELGHTGADIVKDEPLLVLYNNYDIDRFNGEVVDFNGWIYPPGEQKAVRNAFKNLSIMASFGVASVDGSIVSLSPEEVFGQTGEMPMKTLSFWGKHYSRQTHGYEKANTPPHLNANFGYCLTAHKGQGSEWDNVVFLIENGMDWLSLAGRRWVYTALCRAKKNAWVCFQ